MRNRLNQIEKKINESDKWVGERRILMTQKRTLPGFGGLCFCAGVANKLVSP